MGLDNHRMHALLVHERGGPERLEYAEAPVPYVGIGDVLLRVEAASFTPTELAWPSTWIDRSGRDRRPVILGHEVSGVVETLGYGTTGVSVGDAVYGLTDWYRNGAAAGYVAVEARNLSPKPLALGSVDAAAVPLAGLTAWQGLFDHGQLSRGQTVLVHGAGGGVGTYAVQLARRVAARLVATGRAWSSALVTELGADQFIDVEHQRFEDVVEDLDLVLDLVGGDVLARSARLLKPGGVLVSVVEDPGQVMVAQRAEVRSTFFVVEPRPSELRELAQLIDTGDLRPVVGQVVTLADGRAAFEAKRGQGVPGKIVFEVGSTDRG